LYIALHIYKSLIILNFVPESLHFKSLFPSLQWTLRLSLRCKLLLLPLLWKIPCYCHESSVFIFSLCFGIFPCYYCFATNSPTTTTMTFATIKASITSIVFNTYQVISFKLINTNYIYWQMQMKSYLLGQIVFPLVDGSLSSSPLHMIVADCSSLQFNNSFLC